MNKSKWNKSTIQILETNDLSGIILSDLEEASLYLEFESAKLAKDGFARSALYHKLVKMRVDKELGNRSLEQACGE